MGDVGVAAAKFAEVLQTNRALQTISLGMNQITNVGGTALLKVLQEQRNVTLLELKIGFNHGISDSMKKQVQALVEQDQKRWGDARKATKRNGGPNKKARTSTATKHGAAKVEQGENKGTRDDSPAVATNLQAENNLATARDGSLVENGLQEKVEPQNTPTAAAAAAAAAQL